MSGRTFKSTETVDFVVVGSGAAGGVMARELSQAGFSVLVFEQGPRLGPADFEHDELKYFFLNGITVDPEVSPQSFPQDSQRGRESRRGLSACLVCAACRRQQQSFHGELLAVSRDRLQRAQRLGVDSRHRDSPTGRSATRNWSRTTRRSSGRSECRALATPVRSTHLAPSPIPCRRVPVKSSGVLLERGARKLGLHAFPAPMAIASQPFRGRPSCVHCGFCMGFGCEARAKSSALYTMIPEAEATGRCEVRSRELCLPRRRPMRAAAPPACTISTATSASISRRRARWCCRANGAETARLLLNSTSTSLSRRGSRTPAALVGKYLMFNQGASAHAVFEHELNEYKSVQVTRILHDFYAPTRSGASTAAAGSTRGSIRSRRSGPCPSGGDLPLWGADLKARIEAFPRSMVCGRTHQRRCRSKPTASASIPTLKDAWGIPAIRVTYKDHPDDLAFARFLQDRSGRDHARGRRAEGVARRRRRAGVGVHLLGTCRMGNDPSDFGGRQVSPHPRCAKPVPMRRLELRHLRAAASPP